MIYNRHKTIAKNTHQEITHKYKNTMTRQELIETLQPIVRRSFSDPNLLITDDLTPANTPAWTSLSFTQLLTEIENQFGIKFGMLELLQMQNMGSIVDKTLSHLS